MGEVDLEKLMLTMVRSCLILSKRTHSNLRDLAHKFKEDNGDKINPTTVQRYIKQYAKDDGQPILTFKKAQNRAPVSNTSRNKEIRKNACQLLMSYIQSGYDWVFIDETSFEVGYVDVRGWGESGKRLLNNRTIKGFRGTALFAISSSGMQYCEFIRGSVTQNIFNAL